MLPDKLTLIFLELSKRKERGSCSHLLSLLELGLLEDTASSFPSAVLPPLARCSSPEPGQILLGWSLL
jgi:hypothetical protein